MHEAKYYRKLPKQTVQCTLCPHSCVVPLNKAGKCKVRLNENGQLVSLNYGKVSALHVDPIEKKPLYHFFPGKNIVSVGTVGCNLRCEFCQNCEISQANTQKVAQINQSSFEGVLNLVEQTENNIGVAYTYNEPVVWYEFMIDIASKIKELGLYNAVVSNGFVNEEPLRKLLRYIDAFNIDLKAFSEDFYKNYTFSKLQPVKKTLEIIRSAGKHLEITFLLIPGLNDDEGQFAKMVDWISTTLGQDTVLHISRYFPRYKMSLAPTPVSLIDKFYDIAQKRLRFVYIGNVSHSSGSKTICPQCGAFSVLRDGYTTDVVGVNDDGKCLKCNNQVIKYI